MIKELWINVDDQHDYQQKSSRIQEIIGASSGIDEIVIYKSVTRCIKRLRKKVSITEQMIDDLKSFLGPDNVKLVEKENASYAHLIDEFLKYPGTNSLESLEFMKIHQLIRIADALEGIETRLDALEELQDTAEQLRECIGFERPPRYAPSGSKGFNFLRIGGTVYRD